MTRSADDAAGVAIAEALRADQAKLATSAAKTVTISNPEERSLLLYLETQAVDQGTFEPERCNESDLELVRAWADAGFIETGRIPFKEIRGSRTRWIRLSDKAFDEAHKERRARAARVDRGFRGGGGGAPE